MMTHVSFVSIWTYRQAGLSENFSKVVPDYEIIIAKKRPTKGKAATPNFTDGIILQRLSENVQGKCQKTLVSAP